MRCHRADHLPAACFIVNPYSRDAFTAHRPIHGGPTRSRLTYQFWDQRENRYDEIIERRTRTQHSHLRDPHSILVVYQDSQLATYIEVEFREHVAGSAPKSHWLGSPSDCRIRRCSALQVDSSIQYHVCQDPGSCISAWPVPHGYLMDVMQRGAGIPE